MRLAVLCCGLVVLVGCTYFDESDYIENLPVEKPIVETENQITLVLNSVRFVEALLINDSFVESDGVFVLVDYEYQNGSSVVALDVDPEVRDSEGNSYQIDEHVTNSLKDLIAFTVPDDAEGLRLQVKLPKRNAAARLEGNTSYSLEFDVKPEIEGTVEIQNVLGAFFRVNTSGDGIIKYVDVIVENTGLLEFEPVFDLKILRNDAAIFTETAVNASPGGILSPDESREVRLSVLHDILFPGKYFAELTLKDNATGSSIAFENKSFIMG